MLLKIEETFEVHESLEDVWAFWSDPGKVAPCVPGVEVGPQDGYSYQCTINLKVGTSISRYRGELRIARLDAPNHEVEILGEGRGASGRGSGSVKIAGRLRSLASGGTAVAAACEMSFVGMLEQFDSRLATEGSKIIFEEFVQNFRARLRQPLNTPEVSAADAVANILDVTSLAWKIAVAFLREHS